MHSLLKELIKQHFPSAEEIPPKLESFLEDLSQTLSLPSSDVYLQKELDKTYEKQVSLANSTNLIIKELATLDQVSRVVDSLTSQVQERFGFSKTQFFTYNKAANNLKLSSIAGENADIPKAQLSTLPMNIGAVGQAAASQKTIIAADSDLQLPNYPQMIGSDTKSQAAFPVSLNSELFGVLDVQSNLENGIDQDNVIFLETLSLQTDIILNSLKFKVEMLEQMNELASMQKMASSEGWKSFREMSTLSSGRYVYDQNLSTVVPDDQEFQAETAVQNPLEIRGEVIGALGISTDPDQPLTSEEKNLLESISSEVAEALERARLFETSQRSASELAVLNEMGASFAQAENEEFIIENIYKYTSMLMETPQFYVALYHEEEEMISFPYVMMLGERVTEDHPEHHQWNSRPVGTGLTGYIIDHKVPILIDHDAEKTLQDLGLPFLRFGDQTDSWLGVPMIIGDRIIGVISVQSETTPNLYNRHHLDLLTTIASQASVAINNTRLFNQEQYRAQQERTVRTITDKVRRGTDTQNIMQIALEELSHALNADISVIQLGNQEQLLDARKENEEKQTNNQNGNENSQRDQEE